MRRELENGISNSEKVDGRRLSRDLIFYILWDYAVHEEKSIRFGIVK